MIVGLIGFISSGKGTVGDILEQDYDFKKESFAKSLKDAASCIFGWDRDLLEGATPESREWREKVDPYWANVLGKPNFTPRLALQWLGTEAGRNVFGENVWTAGCIKRCSNKNTDYVITDVRFRNEIDAVHKAGGVVARIRRGDDPVWFDILSNLNDTTLPTRADYMSAQAPGLHISEWDWVGAEWDFEIPNDHTLVDLHASVSIAITLMRKQLHHETV